MPVVEDWLMGERVVVEGRGKSGVRVRQGNHVTRVRGISKM